MAKHFDHTVGDVGNRKRQLTTVEIADLGVEREDAIWPVNTLIAKLQAALAEIPAEFRDSAAVRIQGFGDYVSMYAHIEFTRPETDSEFADRIEWLDGLDADEEERDRQALYRLKSKYGT